MEEHPECNYDYVQLFNGEMASSPSIGRYCGTASRDPFTSQNNAVRIEWHTDDSNNFRGFKIRYEVISQGEFSWVYGRNLYKEPWEKKVYLIQTTVIFILAHVHENDFCTTTNDGFHTLCWV